MKLLYLTFSCLIFAAMAALALALLGGKIDLLPAVTIDTVLFVALMWASGHSESDL